METKNDIIGYVTGTPIHRPLLTKCKDDLTRYYKVPFARLTVSQIKKRKDLLLITLTRDNPRLKQSSIISIRDKYFRWLIDDTEQRYTKVK